jgi:glycosyltransferase involved in cell wall biosynthesis
VTSTRPSNGSAPRVLVIIPTMGERIDFLRTCLKSLRDQDPQPILRMVASEETFELLRNRVDLDGVEHVTDPGGGLSAAINAGFQNIQGIEFITWLGDDDTLTSGSLALTTHALAHNPKAVMAYGGLRWMDASGKLTRITIPLGVEHRTLLRWGLNLVWQPGSLYRASTIRRIGGLANRLKYAMDLDMFLNLAEQGPFECIRRPLAEYRVHAGSISSSMAEQQRNEADEIRARHGAKRVGLRRYAAHFASRVVFRMTSRKFA